MTSELLDPTVVIKAEPPDINYENWMPQDINLNQNKGFDSRPVRSTRLNTVPIKKKTKFLLEFRTV